MGTAARHFVDTPAHADILKSIQVTDHILEHWNPLFEKSLKYDLGFYHKSLERYKVRDK